MERLVAVVVVVYLMGPIGMYRSSRVVVEGRYHELTPMFFIYSVLSLVSAEVLIVLAHMLMMKTLRI